MANSESVPSQPYRMGVRLLRMYMAITAYGAGLAADPAPLLSNYIIASGVIAKKLTTGLTKRVPKMEVKCTVYCKQ